MNKHIAEIIEDNKKWELGELMTAFKEINAAAAADKASTGKKFPALATIAATIRKGEFDRLTPEVWNGLADFLDGKHRHKALDEKHIVARDDEEYFYNEIVKYKTAEIMKGRPERGLTAAAVNTIVKKSVSTDESATLDSSDIYRRVKRMVKRKVTAVKLQMDEEKNTPEDYVVPQN